VGAYLDWRRSSCWTGRKGHPDSYFPCKFSKGKEDMLQRLLSFYLQRANMPLRNPYRQCQRNSHNRISGIRCAFRIFCLRQGWQRIFHSTLGGDFKSSPKEFGKVCSVLVATPDGKGDILSVIPWEQTWPASCRLQSLTSFRFPLLAILDGCSEWLGHFRYVASWCICVHILHFC